MLVLMKWLITCLLILSLSRQRFTQVPTSVFGEVPFVIDVVPFRVFMNTDSC